jgi:hypothetical protein
MRKRDNIKRNVKVIGWEIVDWIHVTSNGEVMANVHVA